MYEEETEQGDFDTREQILHASLPFVSTHGWTKKAIAAGRIPLSFHIRLSSIFKLLDKKVPKISNDEP